MSNGDNTINIPEKNEGIKTGLSETTNPVQDNIFENFSTREGNEIDGNNGEYLKLYEKQNEIAKQLEQRAEKNNIKDRDGYKLYFNPVYLSFDDDMIIYNTGMPSNQPHLFKMVNGTFEEIQLFPDKIQYNGKDGTICRNIKKVSDGVYCVELVHMKNGRVNQRGSKGDAYLGDDTESYFVDKSGKVLEQIGKLGDFVDNDGIYNRHNRKNHWGFRETEIIKYNHEGKFQSQELTIFDKNFEKLFIIENSQRYSVQYCDNQACICQDTREHYPRKYIIIDKTGIIAQGTEEELKGNENMQKFLKEEEIRQEKQKENERKRQVEKQIPFGERFKEINHCVISLNEKEKTATIQNNKGDTLFQIGDVLDFHEDAYRPIIRTTEGSMRITERNKDSGVLCIHKYVGGYAKKAIFINKSTGEKLEFDGFKGENSLLQGKLIEVYTNGYDSEIYDENLNKLGMRLWSGYGLYAVARQENGQIKAYLYDLNTGENLCEIDNKNFNDIIKRSYRDENGKDHLIIKKVDGTLFEFSSN